MDTTEVTEKCGHPPCKCVAQTAGGYCSEHCQSASGGADTECHCGHSECD
jgi:hypothetical protein